MSYCKEHRTDNCIECAIKRQTDEIVRAIKSLEEQANKKKPTLWDKLFGAR